MLDTMATVNAAVIAGFWVMAYVADKVAVRREAEQEAKRSEMVFLMGNPAAGKSTRANMVYGATHKFIDCDQFKAAHPDYDPKQPHLLHAWSAAESAKMFQNACTGYVGKWVLDGTGANLTRLLGDIETAKRAGFRVTIFYVKCSLETSLRRNAKRERVVAESVIREKAEQVGASFEIARVYADKVVVVEADKDIKF